MSEEMKGLNLQNDFFTMLCKLREEAGIFKRVVPNNKKKNMTVSEDHGIKLLEDKRSNKLTTFELST